MPSILRTVVPVLLVLALLPACRSTEEAAPARQMEAVIEVRNDNFLDVTLYAIRDGQRYRLGLVNTGHTERFVLDEPLLVGPTFFRFIADPIGGSRSIFVGEFSIAPGDEAFLTIPSYNRR